jgi:KipI family sensor histidine kinase inhibitor
MNMQILPLGDAAVMIRLGDQIDARLNQQVRALDAHLRQHQPAGLIELVPAYASLLVHYDPALLTLGQVSEWIHSETSKLGDAAAPRGRRIEVPVRYGGELGPDLAAVAELHALSPEEVARNHAGRDYVVYMMGFTPGFPYMGILDEAIATPRLAAPRTRVPVGSVGIAGRQTGIYPVESPGGWQIIGRTSLPIFDLDREPPFLFSPGDTVRFVIEALNA